MQASSGDYEDASRVAIAVVDALADAGIKAAIGGSIALGLWAVPRGTKDADLSVFLNPDRYEELLSVLKGAGATPEPDRDTWTPADQETFLCRAREGEVAPVYYKHMRVDIFVPSIPFYDEAERTLRAVYHPDLGRVVPTVSPETLVFKLLFFREKDLLDLRALVARQGKALDHDYVRRHLVDMVGADDDRITAWDGIVRAHLA
jgi:hypothetical protein